MIDSISLKPVRMGIDTHQEPVLYMRDSCPVCRSEGFNAQSRIQVRCGERSVIATLEVVHSDLLADDQVGFSEAAWQRLEPDNGDPLHFSHPPQVASMAAVRGRIYGRRFTEASLKALLADIVAGHLTDVEIAAFVTVSSGPDLDDDEVAAMTRAMIDAGERLHWDRDMVVDKHCVGGLPGNRTTPLVVAIVAANGLLIPKTSSRAITSPAGTADTLETLTNVSLDIEQMRRVVERENGCFIWGGAVHLSPADDILIRIERVLDIDSPSQLVASVLSKKAAAGATHVVIDIPVGPTAKVRSDSEARKLCALLERTGAQVGLTVLSMVSDGRQPVGYGIGPALEARDLLAVLRDEPEAPRELRDRAVRLAGMILEAGGKAPAGTGEKLAAETLESGAAWRKFRAICEAQGGFRDPPRAGYVEPFPSPASGQILEIDNRRLARLAKLAGAPAAPEAGVRLEKALGETVEAGEPLFALHAASTGEMEYAMEYLQAHPDIFRIGSPAGEDNG